MFLSVVLFVLFVAGCWLYCLTDAALTPAAEFRGLPKPAWIALIAATFVLGAIAWAIARLSWRARRRPRPAAARPGPAESGEPDVRWTQPYPLGPSDGFLAAEALGRPPASRPDGRPERPGPIGPDDDPEFLSLLDRVIRGSSDPGELFQFTPA
jgi:hypothetical protein